jgi:hypothetical protein
MLLNKITKDFDKILEIIKNIKEEKSKEELESTSVFLLTGVVLSPMIISASLQLSFGYIPALLTCLLGGLSYLVYDKKEQKIIKALEFFKNNKYNIFYNNSLYSLKKLTKIKNDINSLSNISKEDISDFINVFSHSEDLPTKEDLIKHVYCKSFKNKKSEDYDDRYTLKQIEEYMQISQSVKYNFSKEHLYWIEKYLEEIDFKIFFKNKNKIISLISNNIDKEDKEKLISSIKYKEELFSKEKKENDELNNKLNDMKEPFSIKKENKVLIKSI